jgi:hypothetical protein
MAGQQDPATISLDARVGALSLAVSGPLNLILHAQAQTLGPLSFATWLVLSFGVLCFCEEMGAGKPLNRAGLVLFAAAFCADTAAMLAVDPVVIARAHLLYAFTILGALVFWSVALMHRTQTAKMIGAIGTVVGAGALLLLVGAHLLLGVATIVGFSQLFLTSTRPTFAVLSVIDSVLLLWCVAISILLWSGRIKS